MNKSNRPKSSKRTTISISQEFHELLNNQRKYSSESNESVLRRLLDWGHKGNDDAGKTIKDPENSLPFAVYELLVLLMSTTKIRHFWNEILVDENFHYSYVSLPRLLPSNFLTVEAAVHANYLADPEYTRNKADVEWLKHWGTGLSYYHLLDDKHKSLLKKIGIDIAEIEQRTEEFRKDKALEDSGIDPKDVSGESYESFALWMSSAMDDAKKNWGQTSVFYGEQFAITSFKLRAQTLIHDFLDASGLLDLATYDTQRTQQGRLRSWLRIDNSISGQIGPPKKPWRRFKNAGIPKLVDFMSASEDLDWDFKYKAKAKNSNTTDSVIEPGTGLWRFDLPSPLNKLDLESLTSEEIWWEHFKAYNAWRNTDFNTGTPDIKTEFDDIKIGLWLDNQRTAHLEGTLSPKRQDILQSIGVDWDLAKPKQKKQHRGLVGESRWLFSRFANAVIEHDFSRQAKQKNKSSVLDYCKAILNGMDFTTPIDTYSLRNISFKSSSPYEVPEELESHIRMFRQNEKAYIHMNSILDTESQIAIVLAFSSFVSYIKAWFDKAAEVDKAYTHVLIPPKELQHRVKFPDFDTKRSTIFAGWHHLIIDELLSKDDVAFHGEAAKIAFGVTEEDSEFEFYRQESEMNLPRKRLKTLKTIFGYKKVRSGEISLEPDMHYFSPKEIYMTALSRAKSHRTKWLPENYGGWQNLSSKLFKTSDGDTSTIVSYPRLTREWNPIKNNLLPPQISATTNQKIWWKCASNKDHVWQASPRSRVTNDIGCPSCAALIKEASKAPVQEERIKTKIQIAEEKFGPLWIAIPKLIEEFGVGNTAKKLGISRPTLDRWRTRFASFYENLSGKPIEDSLSDLGIKYAREFRFRDNSVANFYIPDSNAVIEYRLSGEFRDELKKSIESRLLRHPEVEHVIFISLENTKAEIKHTLLRELRKLDEGQSTKP